MQVKKLGSFWDKTAGVSFKKSFKPVFFQTRWGIHTFFVNKPIDVFILSDDYLVVKIKRNLKPWRLYFWNPIYKYVIETPYNHSSFNKIKIGDKVKV